MLPFNDTSQARFPADMEYGVDSDVFACSRVDIHEVSLTGL